MRNILGGLLISVFVAGLCTPALAQQNRKDPLTVRGADDWWFVKRARSNPNGCEGICFRQNPGVSAGRFRLDCEVDCKANPAAFGVKVTKPAKGTTKPAKAN